tara:strand:- start:644 stop:883 length:240 start_codon:yes stop_codon:yes gene_type:complete
MYDLITKHLRKQDETYFQHMLAAWKICVILNILLLKCFIHSILPFLFTSALSSKIECLQKMAKRGKPDDSELYEVFGGE